MGSRFLRSALIGGAIGLTAIAYDHHTRNRVKREIAYFEAIQQDAAERFLALNEEDHWSTRHVYKQIDVLTKKLIHERQQGYWFAPSDGDDAIQQIGLMIRRWRFDTTSEPDLPFVDFSARHKL